MATQSFTNDFVALFLEMKRLTNDNPKNVEAVATTNQGLVSIIEELYRHYRTIEEHRKFSAKRYIPQADPAFLQALREYEKNWKSAWSDAHPQLKIALQMQMSGLSKTKRSVNEESKADLEEIRWRLEADFDPDENSAASDVEALLEHFQYKAEDEPFFERAFSGWNWLRDTVGVNLGATEERWKEFPIFVVKQPVSDKHGLHETRGLFAYLDEIRTAYVAGAFLAALTMCRAVTEILFKYHYSHSSEKDGLGKVIDKVTPRFEWMKNENFGAKVVQANNLLHSNNAFDISSREEARLLVRNWVVPLQRLIDYAPN